MKIGIIGTPGSGKTQLAKFIHKEFYDYRIVDKYVEKFVKRTDSAVGVAASHVVNTSIAIERINTEFEKKGSYITCGTLIETMAYDAIYGLSVPDSRAERYCVQTMMGYFGVLFVDTYQYDKLFWLPSKDEEWRILDYHIEYAQSLFGLKPVVIENRDFSNVIEPLKKYEQSLNEVTKTN